MNISVVTFNSEGDGVTALYIDGQLHTHGDYYHDKIDDWIEGFLAGLEFAIPGSVNRQNYSVPGDKCKSIWEGGDSPPEQWPDKHKRFYKHHVRT